MSNYFDYVDHASRERVRLCDISGVEGGHGGRHSVVRWGGVLAYLVGFNGDGDGGPGRHRYEFMGRWSNSTMVTVACDAVDDYDEIEAYTDITAGVVSEMKLSGYWPCVREAQEVPSLDHVAPIGETR